jgi:hypothetical protein
LPHISERHVIDRIRDATLVFLIFLLLSSSNSAFYVLCSMIKKVALLWLSVFALAVACKKDCIVYQDYVVTDFDLQGNFGNLGLFTTDVRNSGDTIRSVRNQFVFSPEQDFLVSNFRLPGIDILPSAYAKECVQIKRSLTNFDPLKTTFSVDASLDLTAFGLSGVLPAGTNLLGIQEVRDLLLSSIQNNAELHFGLQTPVTVNPAFLRYFNGQQRSFTLTISLTTGDFLSSSATVYLDVPA